jgi:hypothetical protein
MSNNKPLRCEACGRRIRPAHHELRLSDLLSGQLIGRYHGNPDCMGAATRYVVGAAALRLSIVHPERCGDDFERCDVGLQFMPGAAA